MKDYIRLIGQRKGFYLTMLIISLLITIIGTNFHINISMETKQNFVSHLDNLVNQYSVVGFAFVIVMVFCMILLNKFQMNDVKTKEFLETLPVKKSTLELYDYLVLSGILLLDGLISGHIHIVRFSIKAVGEWSQLVIMFLYVFAIYTFLYLCMSEFKNLIAGATFSGLLVAVSQIIVEIIYDTIFINSDWLLSKLSHNKIAIPLEGAFQYIRAVFSPRFYYSKLFMLSGGECRNIYFIPTIVMLTTLNLLLIATLVVLARTRELSKGKIFYHNFLNVFFLGLCGVTFFFMIAGFFGGVLALILTMIGEAIAIWFLTKKRGRIRELPVVERKVWKWPVLSEAMLPYLLAAVGVSIFVSYIFAAFFVEPNRVMFENIYLAENVLPFSIDSFSSVFSIHELYVYLAFPVIVFIILKCVLFAKEGTKARQEFYGSLPVKRSSAFLSKLLLDLGVCMIPMVTVILTSIVYLLHFRSFLVLNANTTGLAFPTLENGKMVMSYSSADEVLEIFNPLIAKQWLYIFAGLGLALFVMGILYLIDAVAVSGIYKIILTISTGVFLFMGSAIALNFVPDLDLLGIVGGLLWGDVTIPGVIIDAILGLLMIFLAGRICKKRDLSKSIFYIKNMQYLFAFIVSMDFGMLMFLGMGCRFQLLPGIFMIIGMVAIFFLVVYYYTPGRENGLKIKKKSKLYH